MRYLKGRLGAFLLCIGCGLGTTAQAAEEGWYVVGFAGQTSVDGIDQAALDESAIAAFNAAGFDVVDATSSVDDSDTGFGLGVGYLVNEHFAVELAYVDLGAANYNANGTVDDGSGAVPASLGLEASAQGPVFSLLGILPIGERFAVFGRLGIASMNSEGSIRVSIDGVSDGTSDSTQRSNGVYGLGGEFATSDRFGIRVEWDRYADVGSDDITGEADVDMISLALRFNFR
ncbi:MAG: outer membrane beta-barrel protein [Steroidobacteraceae bacterium]